MIIDGARDAMRWQEPVEVTLARSLVIRRYSALHCIETSSTSRRLHHVFDFPISPIHFSPSSPPRMKGITFLSTPEDVPHVPAESAYV